MVHRCRLGLGLGGLQRDGPRSRPGLRLRLGLRVYKGMVHKCRPPFLTIRVRVEVRIRVEVRAWAPRKLPSCRIATAYERLDYCRITLGLR